MVDNCFCLTNYITLFSVSDKDKEPLLSQNTSVQNKPYEACQTNHKELQWSSWETAKDT